jgi:hypothetical protein
VGDGGSSAEMDEYIVQLEEELNKLKQEKAQLDISNNDKKVILTPPSYFPNLHKCR